MQNIESEARAALWPPYALAQVNGGSRNFYTWWTLSVNRKVTTWIFHCPP